MSGVACVTGASAGIGRAFAERLARDGFDLIVTARRENRLHDLAEQLTKETGAQVDVIPADLAERAGRSMLSERLASEPRLTLLINNAGFGAYGPFADLDPGTAEDLVDVHVAATVTLSRAALPGMLARDEGSIVSVASLLAFSGTIPPNPLPHRAVYAGAKAFIVTFTQALAGEIAGTNVKAMVCCPGMVKTEFHEIQGIDLSRAPRVAPEDIVTATMAGLERGEVVCVPTVEDYAAVDRANDAARAVIGSGSATLGSSAVPAIASRYLTP